MSLNYALFTCDFIDWLPWPRWMSKLGFKMKLDVNRE